MDLDQHHPYHGISPAPIVGARHVEQLEPALASVEIVQEPTQRDELSALTHRPGSPTARRASPLPATT